jgi:inhibitor of cysteine peptidase
MDAERDPADGWALSVKSLRGAALVLVGALALVAVLATSSGCGGSQTIQVGEDADGTTVKAAVGDVVELSLPENPTTGYEWNLKLDGGLKVQQTEYDPDDTSGELAGSGGVRTWWIEVTATGEHAVAGAYERPWESDDPQAGAFALTISAE